MTTSVKISVTIGTTDNSAGLGAEIWLDNQKIFDKENVVGNHEFVYELSDNDAEHELCFVMKNKTVEHTKIDNAGNIVKDACITVSNLTFEEILLGHTLTENAVYTHDFNGVSAEIQDKFYGIMGCNGRVSLKFSTPMYLWLLENM